MDGFIGLLVIGLMAGAISGWVVGVRSVSGCLPTIVVGVLGAVIGGWVAGVLGFGTAEGFVAALIVAVFGAVLVRIVLRAIEGRTR